MISTHSDRNPTKATKYLLNLCRFAAGVSELGDGPETVEVSDLDEIDSHGLTVIEETLFEFTAEESGTYYFAVTDDESDGDDSPSLRTIRRPPRTKEYASERPHPFPTVLDTDRIRLRLA